MPKFAAIYTLGCRLNTADSALLANRLQQAGYSLRELPCAEPLALILVNSCRVTAEAARKSRQTARKLRHDHPEALIVGTGCAVPDGDWSDAAQLLLSNDDKPYLLDALTRYQSQQPIAPTAIPEKVFKENAVGVFPFLSRAFIKIQEGCNNFCTYCIVPYARGRERSRALSEVLEDCRHAIASGYPELILTGVNTCAYLDNGVTLNELLRQIAALPGDFRIRLSSTEPHLHNLQLLDALRDPANRVCRFLHLSLQYGNDRILQKMNRHYLLRDYVDFAQKAREAMPGLHLGTDLIVGFPGETDADFAECCANVANLHFANIHLFTYSRRAGTPAAVMPGQVPADVAKKRYEKMKLIAQKAKLDFAASFVGQILPVIFEQCKSDKRAHGWSDNYLAVTAAGATTTLDKIVQVQITDCDAGAVLSGKVLE